MLANVHLVLVSMLVGWVALIPARRVLGPMIYHLASVPVGLLGFAWVTGWTSIFGIGYSWPAALLCLGAYTALVAALFVWRSWTSPPPGEEWPEFPIWTYAGALIVIGGSALVAGVGKVSAFSADSWADYELMGLWIHDTGDLTAPIVAIRNALVPSIHAASRMMGADWTYVIYTVLGLLVAGVVLDEVYVRASASMRRLPAGLLSVGVVAIMGTTAPFLFHSIYVHSHMITALYLLIAVVAIARAYSAPSTGYRVNGMDAPTWRGTWLALSGLSVSGIILARPDGLAYAVVPFALFAVKWAANGMRRQEIPVFSAAMLAVPIFVFGVTFARFGLWVQPEKLNGSHVLALLVGYLLAATVMHFLPRWSRGAAWLSDNDNAMRLVAVLAVGGFGVASRIARVDFGFAMANIGRNMIHRGGYNAFWVFALGLIVLTIVFARLRREELIRQTLFTIALFLMVAWTIHGLTHVGRASWGDSYSRVSFHVLPLVFLLMGHTAASLLSDVTAPRCASLGHTETEMASVGQRSAESRIQP